MSSRSDAARPRWRDTRTDVVHADSNFGAGFTLCGDSICNDELQATPTNAKITCDRCIRTIDGCRKITERMIDREGYMDVG